jgi:hypothetical protein
MAPLAPLVRWAALCVEGRVPVWSLFPVVIEVFVASFASVAADVLRACGVCIGSRGHRGRSVFRRLILLRAKVTLLHGKQHESRNRR